MKINGQFEIYKVWWKSRYQPLCILTLDSFSYKTYYTESDIALESMTIEENLKESKSTADSLHESSTVSKPATEGSQVSKVSQ